MKFSAFSDFLSSFCGYGFKTSKKKSSSALRFVGKEILRHLYLLGQEKSSKTNIWMVGLMGRWMDVCNRVLVNCSSKTAKPNRLKFWLDSIIDIPVYRNEFR